LFVPVVVSAVGDFDGVVHGFECLKGERARTRTARGHVLFPKHLTEGYAANVIHGW
jgi:hypothetical protein